MFIMLRLVSYTIALNSLDSFIRQMSEYVIVLKAKWASFQLDHWWEQAALRGDDDDDVSFLLEQ